MSWYTKRTAYDAPDNLWNDERSIWAEGYNACIDAYRDEFDAIIAVQRRSLGMEREED